jgi:Fic family protein
MAYNWQFPEWPNFTYHISVLEPISLEFAQEYGQIQGLLQGLSTSLAQETLLQTIATEGVKNFEIEGEVVSRIELISSIKRNLGIDLSPDNQKDKRIKGIAQLLLEVRNSYLKPLSTEMLCHWHNLLFSHQSQISSGIWRTGSEPMQIISGAIGREIVHFQAPPSDSVPTEMEKLVDWYNSASFPTESKISIALIKAAITHLYFESIHPFEDGNGRIGRALAEKALSQSLGFPVQLSLSLAIEADRKAYYNALKNAQRSLEITDWLVYFAQVILAAQRNAKEVVQFTLAKSKFFELHKAHLNESQLKVINKMFDQDTAGFEGGITAKKYMGITSVSKATATRHLQHLAEIGALIQTGAGRTVRYELNLG